MELIEFLKKPNPAFDDMGLYGGSQVNPQKRAETLAGIVRKYYPGFTDDEVQQFLQKFATEGCGYMAMVNTIFGEFVGREVEFRQIFGFSMYDESGDLSFDRMAVDFYATMDNHNEKSFWIFKWDELNEQEDADYPKGYGTTKKSQAYRWKKYLAKHGVDVRIQEVNVTPDNYEKIATEGSLVVGIQPCVLFDKNGEEVYRSENGHAMTVTGITENRLYTVSSWGKEYYIKQDSGVYKRMEFQQVIY